MPIVSSGEEKQAFLRDFSNLESLRRFCTEMQQYQVASLNYFKHGVGFRHVEGRDKVSVSSSATCVLSLVATGNWTASSADTKMLLKHLLSRETSAGLPPDNPFTIAWILDAVSALEDYSEPMDATGRKQIAKKERILQAAIENGKGPVSIAHYPPSAYLTQLVVRVLRRRNKLTPELEKLINEWAWTELTRQLALVQANSKTQDAFAFAYLLMLVVEITPLSKISPEKASIQRAALQTVFDCQLADGTWPLSRPLFHYPNFGNAHCYEFEMLTQLLQETELEDLLLDNLQKLSLSAKSLLGSVYRLDKGVRAWASGHHPQLEGPESWTTASAYHFAHVLDRILAEAVRRELFRYLEAPFPRPSAAGITKDEFAKDFLDSEIEVQGEQHSLRDYLWEHFVQPLAAEAKGIANGRALNKRTPRSAIFFGPPGTSKTDLSRKIADFLCWPLLSIDPSHLLRNGMDGIQAEANTIFRMLEQTERVVVLFDEFDELVLERGSPKAEAFSRFLTTAMLPKLATIHNRATLVFIIATNNIGDFDLAIRRQGRFDRVMQIMPPTYKAKMTKKDWGAGKIDVVGKLRKLRVTLTAEIEQKLGNLTYGEYDALATALANLPDRQEAIKVLDDHWKKCTLQTRVSKAHISKEGETTWAERCKTEAIHNS
jgi:ATPase family protein associated with various cellular activities (AAA)